MVILCVTFWRIVRLFSTVAAPFYIPSDGRVLISPHSCQHLLFSFKKNKTIAILVDVKWYFTMVF